MDAQLQDKLVDHLILLGCNVLFVISGKWLANWISRRDSLRGDLEKLKEKQRKDMEAIEDRLQLLEERNRLARYAIRQLALGHRIDTDTLWD